MKVILTGSLGYKGSVLVPKLRAAGHEVIGIDTGWFGGEPQIKSDIRNLQLLPNAEAIIHLAGIANDPCGELDSKLTWEVNVHATMNLSELAVRAGIKQFIFASSASVYGLKDNKPVTEEDSLAPVSDYNKTKQVAERVLLSYADKMAVQIIRPATVCGVSPRMRLDTMVNSLTMQALTKGVITAHCGEHGANLMRPNIHIDDVTDLYVWMLERPHLTGVYNAGFENLSAMETAELIAKQVDAEITITTVKDKRSYAVDSSKLLSAGFKPKRSVKDAISEIVLFYEEGLIEDEERAYNLHWMRKNGLVAS
ncbi:MAG TPA: SDR family oxidoreductase [Candidatus Binatia bacterium]|nr:SDR family oxidoreductase [Candidatus Binatia bacterium]